MQTAFSGHRTEEHVLATCPPPSDTFLFSVHELNNSSEYSIDFVQVRISYFSEIPK